MKQPPFDTLAGWLAWQESLHPEEIELGLERIRRVAGNMDIMRPAPYVITVAGTNGKGSSVHMLSCALLAAGYRVGCYTSPHLQHYNERVSIAGQFVSDDSLCEAFSVVELARRGTALTYFEFGTLATLWLLQNAGLDIAILEVGLGGRLDAVNIVDADLALVTNIGLDHTDWLGDSRQTIGREKAGIFRSGQPAVFNDRQPLQALEQVAAQTATHLYRLGHEYNYHAGTCSWTWRHAGTSFSDLARPAGFAPHQVQNAAGVLMCLKLMQERFAFDLDAAAQNLCLTLPPGRNQWMSVAGSRGDFPVLLDVAHNREAAGTLLEQLRAQPCSGKTLAVFAALKDKPVEDIAAAVSPAVDQWLVAGLDIRRGCEADVLAKRLHAIGLDTQAYATVADAWHAADRRAGAGDRVIVFGSFYTVQAVLDLMERRNDD